MIRKNIFLLFALVGFAGTVTAQNHITLNATLNDGPVTASGSITLAPGFESTPGGGDEVHLFITPAAAISEELGTGPSDRNYVISYNVRKAGISDPADSENKTDEVNPVIQYDDGLGRPEQIVRVKGSPGARDVVQHIAYNAVGREIKKYLPYSASAASSDGSFKSSALTEQDNFYDSPTTYNAPGVVETDYPFAEIVYEASPLDRVVEQGAPGANYQVSANHTVEQGYSSNATNEVKLWTISSGAATSTYYLAGTLYKYTTTDEGSRTIEFKDKDGRVVLKQAESATNTFISTYYVYDDAGNLRYVIPSAVTSTFLEGSPAFQQYIYAYHYDDRRRVIEKKIPGKGWEEFVYNTNDQVVLQRDTIQSNNSKWLFTKYDVLGRVIMTGIISSGTSRSSWQSTINGAGTTAETRDNANASGTTTSYTNGAYPTSSIDRYHTINYYDDYEFFHHTYSYAGSKMTRGLLTGSRVNVLGTADTLLTMIFYDNKGRAVKTFSQHYKGASQAVGNYDEVTNTYTFTGELNTSTRQHKVGGSTTLTVYTRNEYDHTGRRRNTWMKINSGDSVLLSQMDYNEVGQAAAKKLHSPDLATSFLQTQAYTYNERGWLKTSSAPMFAMELKYDDGTIAQYNGNITNQNWGTPGSLSKTYTYKYDLLNRLSYGTSGAGSHEKSITYNDMGNITGLRRYIPSSTLVDQLAYTYTGNRLATVYDTTTANASANYQLPETTNYAYDYNGNLTSRDNTNGSYGANDISSITYNHLNLPITVTATGGTVTYIYDANGRKLKKSVSGGDYREYIDGIEYKNGSIDVLQTGEGRATPGSPYLYEYNLADHLGNSRVRFDNNSGTARKIQENDYYPFGLESYSYYAGTKNEYLYNNKELQEEFRQYDYGARFYDPVIGRWNVIDPSSESYMNISGYAYAANNPIYYIDPDGRDIDPASREEWERQKKAVTSERDNVQGRIDNLAAKAEKKGWSAEKLASRTGNLGERAASLNGTIGTLGVLEKSSQTYSLQTGAVGEGSTTMNTTTGNVVLNYGSTANFVHEVAHGGQYEAGEIAFSSTGQSLGQDLGDEIGAYKAQFGYDPSSVSGLRSTSTANSFGGITGAWVQGLVNPVNGTRPYGPGGSANTGLVPVNINSTRNTLMQAYPNVSFQGLPANYTLKSIPGVYYKH